MRIMSYILGLFVLLTVLINGCNAEDAIPEETVSEKANSEEIIETAENEEKIEEKKTEIKASDKRQKPAECEGSKISFDYPPVDLERTTYFEPLGLMSGSHVTPVDHHYFKAMGNAEPVDVYSPASGYVTSIQNMKGPWRDIDSGEMIENDFRLVIEHTCTISSIFIHTTTLSPKLAAVAPEPGSYSSVRVPVDAGEVIGTYYTNIDYNIVDTEFTLTGFITPEYYVSEAWKTHIPNTYEYFNEPIKSKLKEISLRTEEPIAGKIDYDVDGRLVGTWIKENALDKIREDSRSRELNSISFAYDYIDPENIVISMGEYNGEPEQSSIKGNKPDPAEVSVEDGLVKYELVSSGYFDGDKDWDWSYLAKGIKAKNYENVNGIVLVQMLEDRKIKFEAFPGKTASRVTKFTENAEIYVR
ncbi:hypothetical protein CMO88_01385 [Candidatus Woesearchaeota archaeon]|nr:hypothetical protein [Candidatus Woesearchaeota archaeon]|tara:strand:- start:24883 stop:26127 length:1245 start_codon:yes stop_codon:yes gene_type:complete